MSDFIQSTSCWVVCEPCSLVLTLNTAPWFILEMLHSPMCVVRSTFEWQLANETTKKKTGADSSV